MKDTKIEWADHTFNHVVGCLKVSPGCANCYAEAQTERFGKDFKIRRRTSEANWRQVSKWNHYRARCPDCGHWNHATSDVCQADGCSTDAMLFEIRRPRVFCASMSDWLDDRDVVMPDGSVDKGGVQTLADLLDIIPSTPNIDWLLLTKRPEKWCDRMEEVINYAIRGDSDQNVRWAKGEPPSNVWFGVSAEDQPRWDERVPVLLSISAAVRFVSCEPMLGRIDMRRNRGVPLWFQGPSLNPASGIDWVIFGGESGRNRRPFEIDWLADGIRQCDEAGVRAFVKQDAALKSGQQGRIPDELWRRKEWPEGRAK